ncbi:MAG: hypothetical protein ACK4FS_10600 [Flavobacterium sp.]
MEEVIIEKISIPAELLEQINKFEEKQVIVHCIVNGNAYQNMIRVWPSIYIFPKETKYKCRLLNHFNIVMYPKFQYLNPFCKHKFTLIFEGLPDSCESFDIKEVIPDIGAFEAFNIKRNGSDVYYVDF